MAKLRSTRSGAPKKLPQPKVSGRPLDPSEASNWEHVEPATKEEMDEWRETAKNLLMADMAFCKAKAEDEKARTRIANAQIKLDEECRKQESELNTAERKHNDNSLVKAQAISKKSPKKSPHTLWAEKYARAQGLWEDFFYLQNPSNRPRTDDERRSQKAASPGDDHFSVDMWRRNMIRLFNKWGVDDGSKCTEPVGPEQLHELPDIFEKTAAGHEATSMEMLLLDMRRLDEAIDKRRAHVEDTKEPLYEFPDDPRHTAAGRDLTSTELFLLDMERLDEAISKMRADVDSTLEKVEYQLTGKLPDNHQPYHSATEHSLPRHYENSYYGMCGESAIRETLVSENTKRILMKRRGSKEPPYIMQVIEAIPEEQASPLDPEGGSPIDNAKGTGAECIDEPSEVENEDGSDDDMSLPDNTDEEERLDDNPPGDDDEESDDEDDPFTRAYLGLDIDMTDASALPGSGSGGVESDYSDKSDKKDDSDSDDADDDDPAPKARTKRRLKAVTAKPGSQRKALVNGETFEEDPNEAGNFSWVTLTHTLPSGRTIEQRDRIPAFTPKAEDEFAENNNNKPVTVVYPENTPVPIPRSAKQGRGDWVLGDDGVYRRGKDLEWRPVFILRKFRHDTGEYLDFSDKRHLFDDLIESNFSYQSVSVWNKAVRQYLKRNCAIYNEQTARQPPWSNEEVARAADYLNSLAHQRGLYHLIDNWESVVKNATAVLDKHREEILHKTARGADSTRTKFSRAGGVHNKLKDVADRRGTIPDAELKPRNLFKAKDFSSETKKNTGSKDTETEVGAGTKKRKAASKTKTKGTKTKSTHGETGGGGRSEEAGEGDEGDDEVEGSAPPPLKRRKR